MLKSLFFYYHYYFLRFSQTKTQKRSHVSLLFNDENLEPSLVNIRPQIEKSGCQKKEARHTCKVSKSAMFWCQLNQFFFSKPRCTLKFQQSLTEMKKFQGSKVVIPSKQNTSHTNLAIIITYNLIVEWRKNGTKIRLN